MDLSHITPLLIIGGCSWGLFGVLFVNLLGQMSITTEAALGIASAVTLALAGAVTYLFKLLIDHMLEDLKAVRQDRDKWRQIVEKSEHKEND